MIDLLKNMLPVDLNIDPARVIVPYFENSGTFTLSDANACDACHVNRPHAPYSLCNQEILKIDAGNQSVVVVEYEKYVKSLNVKPISTSKCCDLIIYDGNNAHNKIAFCDLTCSDSRWVVPNQGKYPEGKRAYAFIQMIETVKTLLTHDLFNLHILTYPEQVCLFGWREPLQAHAYTEPEHNNPRQNLLAFTNTPASQATQFTTEQQILNRQFKLIQIKYPTPYRW